jgi:hypothetical protein
MEQLIGGQITMSQCIAQARPDVFSVNLTQHLSFGVPDLALAPPVLAFEVELPIDVRMGIEGTLCL